MTVSSPFSPFGVDHIGRKIGRILPGAGVEFETGASSQLVGRLYRQPEATLWPHQLAVRQTCDSPLPNGSDYIIGTNFLSSGYSTRRWG